MLKFNGLIRRVQRVRRYFNHSAGRFVAIRRRPIAAAVVSTDCLEHAVQTTQGHFMDLFPATTAELDELRLRQKYAAPRPKLSKKKAKRVKGLQYKLKYWRGVPGGERKRKFSSHTVEAEASNDYAWPVDVMKAIARQLVDVSFREAATRGQRSSNTIAEIVAWVERRFDDSPLSFEVCCAAAGYDPEELRDQFFKLLVRKYGSTFPHYRVLRNGIIDAEYGDPDAIVWVKSNSEAPLSFVDCCKALSFDAEKARASIHLPMGEVSRHLTRDTQTAQQCAA